MFGTISDPILLAAALTGAVAMLLTFLVSLLVLTMRLWALRRERLSARAQARWRGVFVRVAAGDEVPLPRLLHHEALPVILLWSQLQETLRGDAHARLNDLGERIGLYRKAERLARSRRAADRVMGVATLGQFARPGDWSRLLSAMQQLHTPSSIAAARALLRIDAVRAAELVLERYLSHSDWPAARVGTLLRETPLDAVGRLFERRLLEGSLYDQLRLLPLLRFAEVPQVDGLLDRLVRNSHEPQVLSLALRQIQSPGALDAVRALAHHGDPLVRSAAAQALGRIGASADEDLLRELMADSNWWVRYRAAQALVGMPDIDADDVVQLRRMTTDAFARDMLDHVMAERILAGTGGAAT